MIMIKLHLLMNLVLVIRFSVCLHCVRRRFLRVGRGYFGKMAEVSFKSFSLKK